MVKPIVRNEEFLKQESKNATKEDASVAQDLLDTLSANAYRCVGMAANMIGVQKNIIAVLDGNEILVMLNPVIIKTSAKYAEKMEGCLSLDGERKAKRYETVEVKYRDVEFKKQRRKFCGFAAQIVQHEIDHCHGILI